MNRPAMNRTAGTYEAQQMRSRFRRWLAPLYYVTSYDALYHSLGVPLRRDSAANRTQPNPQPLVRSVRG